MLFISISGKSQTDKVAHFGVGYIFSSIATGIVIKNSHNQHEWVKSLTVGIGTSILAGTAKELYDLYDYGRFDWEDLGATVIGGIGGTISVKITINQTRKPPHHE